MIIICESDELFLKFMDDFLIHISDADGGVYPKNSVFSLFEMFCNSCPLLVPLIEGFRGDAASALAEFFGSVDGYDHGEI